MIIKKHRRAVVIFGSVSRLGKASDTGQVLADTIHRGLRSGSKFARFTLHGYYV
jgi:2,3-bisphosphoglycerate-independent phosphoglycerate mutase